MVDRTYERHLPGGLREPEFPSWMADGSDRARRWRVLYERVMVSATPFGVNIDFQLAMDMITDMNAAVYRVGELESLVGDSAEADALRPEGV